MDKLDAEIFDYLILQNIKYGSRGFVYCAKAIRIVYDKQEIAVKLEDVYFEISKQSTVDTKCISRSIRYALKPIGVTNKEFISRTAYELMIAKIRTEALQHP